MDIQLSWLYNIIYQYPGSVVAQECSREGQGIITCGKNVLGSSVSWSFVAGIESVGMATGFLFK